MSGSLSGKIALVTGASRGLGYALARALASEGAHVIAVARTVGGLEELDDEIQQAGGAATLVPLDVTDEAGLSRLGAAVHDRWGRLDILAHCAAQDAPLSPASHAARKDLAKALSVNVAATHGLIRVTEPLLRASEAGLAVFMDDPTSSGAKFNAAYGASKAAASAIFQSWAAEHQRSELTVWRAAPPPMPTALRARFFPGEDQSALTPTKDVAEAIIADIISGGQKNA